MAEDISKKVINIFSRHNSELPPVNNERVKFYAGFNYVKLHKDTNGNKFNAESLVNKLTEIDLFALGKQILMYYGIFIAVYLLIAYIFYTLKFRRVRVKLNQYNGDLKRLYEMYKNEKPLKEDNND